MRVELTAYASGYRCASTKPLLFSPRLILWSCEAKRQRSDLLNIIITGRFLLFQYDCNLIVTHAEFWYASLVLNGWCLASSPFSKHSNKFDNKCLSDRKTHENIKTMMFVINFRAYMTPFYPCFSMCSVLTSFKSFPRNIDNPPIRRIAIISFQNIRYSSW